MQSWCLLFDRQINHDPSISRNQLFVLDVLGFQQPKEGVAEQPGVVTIVEPPLKLVQVGVQVLHGDFVVCANDRPFKEAPDVLNGVRVNVIAHPFLYRVVDCLVRSVLVSDAPVRCPFVCEVGYCLIGCNLSDELVEGCTVAGLDNLEDDLAAPLDGTDDDGFVIPVILRP